MQQKSRHDNLQLEWFLRQAFYGRVLEELNRHFQILGVPYMPIKGAYLIKTGLATSLDIRKMVDIDILICKKDFEKVVNHFSCAEGFRKLDESWQFLQPFCYVGQGMPVTIEFNYLLSWPERFRLLPEELFYRGLKLEHSFAVLPCPEDALLIHICHMLVHVAHGLSETAIEEINLLCSDKRFDWTIFRQSMRKTGISFFIFVALHAARRYYTNLPYSLAEFLQKLFSCILFIRAPKWLRILFFNLLFVRDPLGLALRRLGRFLGMRKAYHVGVMH